MPSTWTVAPADTVTPVELAPTMTVSVMFPPLEFRTKTSYLGTITLVTEGNWIWNETLVAIERVRELLGEPVVGTGNRYSGLLPLRPREAKVYSVVSLPEKVSTTPPTGSTVPRPCTEALLTVPLDVEIVPEATRLLTVRGVPLMVTPVRTCARSRESPEPMLILGMKISG
jgi:hypothetical protein